MKVLPVLVYDTVNLERIKVMKAKVNCIRGDLLIQTSGLGIILMLLAILLML